MEELIKSSFCNNCINKGKDCMIIEKIENKNLLTYRCVNYAKKNELPKNEYFDYNIRSDR